MSATGTKQLADYTEGSIFGSILKMGLPSMFGFVSHNIYAMVDMYWVSRLSGSEAGVAAITFFGTILWAFFSFNQLVGPGSVAMISRRFGEKDYDGAEKVTKETLILKLFFGGIFGAVGFFSAEFMLRLMGATGTSLQLGVDYGRIMFCGMGIMYATYSIFTAMRGVANPQMAMFLMIASNVLNMILDPFLMFGWMGLPAWGIEGAAVASVFSYCLTLAVGLYLFYSGRTNVRLHLRGKLPISLSSMWKIIRIGIPAWAGSMSYSGARLVITPIIATFGTSVVAAYGVGNQVTGFGVMILVGIGLGLSSLIGHNLGSGKIERARKTADRAVMLGIGIMTGFAIVTFIFAGQIMRLFFETPETVEIGITMLRVFAIGFPFLGAFFMVEEVHMGVGLNSPAMVINVVYAWVFQVLPIYWLTQYMGYDQVSIWISISVAGAAASVLFYVYYLRGRWLTVKV